MNGIITTIQRMSIHDGPGIRSTIFLKGCNLHCLWCHNPETYSAKIELEWIADKCIGCGECMSVCRTGALTVDAGIVQLDKKKCMSCFVCMSNCFTGALQKVGREISPAETFSEIEQDFPFFKESQGGITISGGEPMLQEQYVTETLQLFKNAGCHTAIETNLTVPWEKYQRVLEYIDLVMADLKLMNDQKHRQWTGGSNRQVLENILKLEQSGKAYWLRTPIVPRVNHSKKEVEEIVAFVSGLKNIQKFELLPFHSLAASKYKNLGIDNFFEEENTISQKELECYNSILEKYKVIRK